MRSYFFRDQQGLEVDFLIPGRGGAVRLLECKASRTVTPAMARPMQKLAEVLKKKTTRGAAVESTLVHRSPRTPAATHAVAPGVKAMPWQEFLAGL